MNHWLDALRAAGLSDETVRCRRNKLSHTARCIGLSPMTVTAEDLIGWTSAQAWKTETRRGYRKTYVSFFRWLHESGRRADDPSELLPVVRRPKPKPRPCPDRYIIAALHKATPLERIMLRLAAECGLRRAEIARVNSRDVMDDLLGKSLIITGKGDKQRIVPLPDDLADAIEHCGGWLLPGRWGGHVEQSYVNRHISRLLPDGWAATVCATGMPRRPTSRRTTCSWSRVYSVMRRSRRRRYTWPCLTRGCVRRWTRLSWEPSPLRLRLWR